LLDDISFLPELPYLESHREKNMTSREELIEELIEYFRANGLAVHGARGADGYKMPPPIPNDGYGDQRPRMPDVVGMDTEHRRIVFGVIRTRREELDSESALTDYNVYLDHRSNAGDQSSRLVVMVPQGLESAFMDLITHYIHREYWHRVTTVTSRQLKA
jgi:hypothetical protein